MISRDLFYMAMLHPLPPVIPLPAKPSSVWQHGEAWVRQQSGLTRDELRAVGLGALLAMSIAGLGWLAIPADYTAQAILQLNTAAPLPVKETPGVEMPRDPAALRTEIDVLSSRPLARAALLASGQAADAQATETFVRRLDVQLVPGSDTLLVKLRAREARQAALEVNALVTTYLTRQQALQEESARAAGAWVDGRLRALQQNVTTAELAVARFRAAHRLTAAASGLTLGDQQLSDLNSQLLLARAQEAEAGARALAAERRGPASSQAVLDSPLLQQLHEQEAAARRNVALLAARYGARHPAMQAARQELAALEGKINEETAKVQASLGTAVLTAQARADALAAQLGALQAGAGRTSADAVQLAELERQAQASRVLYESFLARSKELAQPGFYQPATRVIALAEPPLATDKPSVWLVLALVGVIGGLAGLVLARRHMRADA